MIPRNELGVIVEFSRMATEAGFEILEISAAYPDAIIRKDGRDYRVEFEYKLSNFYQHGHDPRQCDLVICWENDDQGFILPVIALNLDDWQATHLELPDEWMRELAYWKYKAREADNWKRRALIAEGKLTLRGDRRAAHKSTDSKDAIKPSNGPPPGDGWRIEVFRGGEYYQWRRGSGENRQCVYGGKFTDLTPEQQAAYHANRKSYSRTKEAE